MPLVKPKHRPLYKVLPAPHRKWLGEAGLGENLRAEGWKLNRDESKKAQNIPAASWVEEGVCGGCMHGASICSLCRSYVY